MRSKDLKLFLTHRRMRQSASVSPQVKWSLNVTIIIFLFSFFHLLVSRELISEICNMSAYIWASRKCYKSNKEFKPLLSQFHTLGKVFVQERTLEMDIQCKTFTVKSSVLYILSSH